MSLENDQIVVTGLGMVSSLGLDVVTSCAAARAGINRLTELHNFSVYTEDEWANIPVVGHVVTGISEGFEGFGKAVRLGGLALSDLVSYGDIPSSDFARTGFFLNLSSQYYAHLYALEEEEKPLTPLSENEPEDLRVRKQKFRERLIPAITELSHIDIAPQNRSVYFGDHSGIIAAVQDASRKMIDGDLDRCIVGGIDSYVESDVLTAANYFRLVKTSESPCGFIPGEAASFVLIERYSQAMARRARVEATIEAPALASEPCHRLSGEPSVGIALTDAISTTIENCSDKGQDCRLIIGNLNGDAFRSNEWGHALVRLCSKYPLGDIPVWYPAVAFGDTGASTGSTAICMAVRAFVRSYSASKNTLLWLSSDNGTKAGLYVREFTGR